MSQFHPTQHAGDTDFQMWQQQMMYKQLQEFQRQQQLQQPDHGARMQPSFGQFHAPAKPLPGDQFSTMSNEMPNNEGTSSAWPHNFSSGDPNLTSNSQMLNNGSANWDQFAGAPVMGNFMNGGSMFANAQNQSMRPMGLATHQVEQPFYPMHATSSRGSGNQYSEFLGIPADSQSAMARVGSDQSEKTSRPFNSPMNEHGHHLQGASSLMQNFHGKGGFLNNSSMQSQGDNIKAGSPAAMNHLQLGFQGQDFHSRPNQVDFQVGAQEKSTMQPASGRASLDPTEEKILFGNDEDSNWGALLRGDNDNGNPLDNDNLGGAFSSLQSGSWSALMQEALQSTTSENSPKEEWSGLSFQKTEQMTANNSNSSGRDGSKLAALSGRNIENARHSPASSYADGAMNNPSIASFQHAMRTPYERRGQMPHESPSATVNNHQSISEVNNGYFQQSLKQNQTDGRHEQVHLANGLWAHQKSEPQRNNSHSTGAHAAPPSAQGFWMSQQNTPDRGVNRESGNNQNDWKTNNALGQDINNTPNFNSNQNSWKSSGGHMNSVQRIQQMKSDMSTAHTPNESSDGKNISMMGSSMPMVTQDHYLMIAGQSGEQVGMNRSMGHRVPETAESPETSTDQRPSDCNQEYLNATPNEKQAHLINHGQRMASDSAARRHSAFAGSESQNLGQSGQQVMGSFMFQNHAMGSSGMNVAHSPGNTVSNSMFPPQSHQMRNNLQQRFGTNTNASSNIPSANEKMLVAQEQFQSRHGLPNSSSAFPFGGSDAGLAQNRAVQNSQHMLQLLHKVDNSRSSNTAADMPNSSLGIQSAQQQLNQSSLQGFGLRLAPPSQRQSTSGHLWSNQTNIEGKQPDQSAQEDDQTQLPATTSQSLLPPHPTSQSSSLHTSETDHAGQPVGRLPQLNSGQQYPAAEARSGSVPMPQHPQQGSSATVFKNVWTNISAQRLAGMQANKITPNILQSMMFPNNAAASNLWNTQKTDDQGQRAATPSDVATSSANSQNQDTKQSVDSDGGLTSSQMVNFDSTGANVSRGNEALQKPSSDGSFVNPVSSLAHLRQQGIMSTRHGENPVANFQAMHSSHNTANNGSGIVLHGSPTPSNIQQQNYSLLHQVRAMRHTDIDPGNAVGKAEIGPEASQIDWKSGQRFAHVANNSVKSSTDNTGSPSAQGSFPSDMKMLSFAPRNTEERNSSIPSQLPSGELPSQGMVTAQNDQENQVQPIGANAVLNSVERNERPRISPQMAPSWFGHYGNYRNGQNLAMLNAQKTTALPYNFQKASWNIDNNSAEHRVETGQSVRPGNYVPSTRIAVSIPSDAKATSMMRRPKKRKSTESALVSWHKLIESPQKLRNISTSEMDWAWAANRLIEKDDAETLEDGPLNYLPRKRLILTTQLIQQLLPAIPATVLRAQAISSYESATYTLSMLTLRDACNMASSSLYNSCSPVDDENNPSEQTTSAKKMEDKVSKAVEVFVGRIQKMENDFISLNKKASILDVQLECQDLERISIVNRLGRFHGRNHAAAVEGSSTSEMASRRICPERHVMSFAVPGNLPEGVFCLSL